MATIQTFPFDKLILPVHIASRLIQYSPPANNISSLSSVPSVDNKVKVYNNFLETPLFNGFYRLEWSPTLATFIYWTDNDNFSGDEYFMSYEEFGTVDKNLVRCISIEGVNSFLVGQYSNVYGFGEYRNLAYLSFYQQRALIALDFDSIKSLKGFFSYACSFDGDLILANNRDLRSFQFIISDTHSITIGNSPLIRNLTIEFNIYMTSVNVVGSTSDIDDIIYINDNYNLSSLVVPLDTVQGLDIYNNALTSYSVRGTSNLLSIDIGNNFLTSLNIDACPQLNNIRAYDNIFSTETVDNLFMSASSAADMYNLDNGYIDLSGANGVPSSVSESARNNLISRGWSVYSAEYSELYHTLSYTDPNIASWMYTTASNGNGDGLYSEIYTETSQSVYSTPNIKTLVIDGLSELDGDFHFDRSCAKQTLESLTLNNLPNLTTQSPDSPYTVLISNCRKLSSLSLTGCSAVEVAFLEGNFNLTSLNLSGSTSITNLSLNFNFLLSSVDLSVLPELLFFNGQEMFALESIDFTSNPLIQSVNMSNEAFLSNLSSVNISGSSDLIYLNLYNNTKLTSLDLSGCTSLETIDISRTGISSLDLSESTNLTTIYCQEGIYESVTIPITYSLTYIRLYKNKLSAASINKILVDLVTANQIDGYIDISGEYVSGVLGNAAIDSISGGYDGIAAKNTLVSRGWSVYYN